VAGISRQVLYRPISTRPAAAGPGRGRPGDAGIVEVAKANPTDGTRMVAALATRELGQPVNRKRVQRVMRQHRLLQPVRGLDRRRRPGYFRVTRPDELWHMDMTKVWTAAHGWVYLHVIVDCCTREIAGWTVDVRTRSNEAIACVDAALLARNVPPRRLVLGTDNGSQFTARDFRRHLSARGVTHRRGGYRDPESQAFIESWFGQFKKRCVKTRYPGDRVAPVGGRQVEPVRRR
jgi:putative transposase